MLTSFFFGTVITSKSNSDSIEKVTEDGFNGTDIVSPWKSV